MAEKLKIMLVDPDVKDALSVVNKLARKGFYVSHLASLENVVTLSLKNSYQVIIVAASFQKEETHELIHKIKAVMPDISIIAAINQSTPELEKRIRTHGIAFFMGKPIQIDDLVQVLKRLVVVHKQFF